MGKNDKNRSYVISFNTYKTRTTLFVILFMCFSDILYLSLSLPLFSILLRVSTSGYTHSRMIVTSINICFSYCFTLVQQSLDVLYMKHTTEKICSLSVILI